MEQNGTELLLHGTGGNEEHSPVTQASKKHVVSEQSPLKEVFDDLNGANESSSSESEDDNEREIEMSEMNGVREESDGNDSDDDSNDSSSSSDEQDTDADNSDVEFSEVSSDEDGVWEMREPEPPEGGPEEERRIIKGIKTEMSLGQTWYLISARWLQKWKEYTRFRNDSDDEDSSDSEEAVRPGPIDNTEFLKSDIPYLRRDAIEGIDYNIIAEEKWHYFAKWYGGGPPLPRKTIATGWKMSNIVVEVRPLRLQIVRSSEMDTTYRGFFSKCATVGELKQTICKKLRMSESNVRVWDWHHRSKLKLLNDSDEELEEAQIIDDQLVLFEERDKNGKWPKEKKKYHHYSESSVPGVTGLSNLGNTCFMNSSLQCLSNTPPLCNYFLSGRYREDLNPCNPLGMKGELAKQYYELMEDLWSGRCRVKTPREFKWKLERFAPQFSGYQQHDSQELLGFLLDGLHEDLNRVLDKPYVEAKESDGREDDVVALEAWEGHLCRNDSIIVDNFQGQLKSTLICPIEECGRVSITFDPMMYLSLPLPMNTAVDIKVKVVFYDPDRIPLRVKVQVDKFAKISDLASAVSQLIEVDPECLLIVEEYKSLIYREFKPTDEVSVIQKSDVIMAFEVPLLKEEKEQEKEKEKEKEVYKYSDEGPAIETNFDVNWSDDDNWMGTNPTYFSKKKKQKKKKELGESDIVHLPLVHRKEERCSSLYYRSTKKVAFGVPCWLSIRRDVTYKELYREVLKKIRRFLEPMDDSDDEIRNMSSDSSDSPDSSDSDSDSSISSDDEMDESDNREKLIDGQEPLFIMKAIDSALREQWKMENDDTPLMLERKQLIELFWFSNMTRFYNHDAERDLDIHPSAEKKYRTFEDTDDSVSLTDCIELFTRTEQLGPEDPWYCNKCKEHRQATKKFDLFKLPKILVIHLKRFSYRNRYWREKIDCLVDFPLTDLDLTPFVLYDQDVPPIYDLYAVSNHFGSLGGGHYTAYAKNHRENKWYKFDDSYVSEVSPEMVKTPAAYVLFYRRQETSDIEWTQKSSDEAKEGVGSESDESSDPKSESSCDDSI